MTPSLTERLIVYRESLGNQESRELIGDVLDELSAWPWRASVLVEELKVLRSSRELSPATCAGSASPSQPTNHGDAEPSAVLDGWNPRPHPDSTDFSRWAYNSGYCDARENRDFGSSDGGRYGAFSDYRTGWNDGHADRRAALAAEGQS